MVAANASAHPLGILRLKFPAKAPSRSTLKLDEAIQVFMSKSQQQQRLQASMIAVDQELSARLDLSTCEAWAVCAICG